MPEDLVTNYNQPKEGEEQRGTGRGIFHGLGQEVAHTLLLIFHWRELSHVAILNQKEPGKYHLALSS